MTQSYAHPEVLVDTEWAAQRLDDPSIVIVEVNRELADGYNQGHIPGAVGWSLNTDLENQLTRDIPSVRQVEDLLGRSGIDNDTTILLYADGSNRPATWAFWVLKYYRHKDVRLINGGREKWVAEARPMSNEAPSPAPKTYRAGLPDKTLRATKDYIVSNLRRQSVKLLDTRTYEEYTGRMASAPGLPESGIIRKGRIPGAIFIPWDDGAAEDGTFKPVEELRRLYQSKGISPENEVIPYCRLGVKASHSWFALKYLLGYERVRNYDGSWAEWGNAVGVPIETGETN